ncbi:hypothetical protein FE88_24515 [Azospirillum brasilense]|nr:hypothetical protein AMK58_18575 [Azospirillum brasilense]OPH18667.1 hypothetical protein FE88_24515 [Azospirillum brasilense]PWC92819.1 hypothetical protein AEJ54_14525 [Azospirillum sp. Sp 7]
MVLFPFGVDAVDAGKPAQHQPREVAVLGRLRRRHRHRQADGDGALEHRAGGVETVVPDGVLDGGNGVELGLDPPGDLLRPPLPAQGTRHLRPFQLAEQDRLEEGAERAGVDGAGLHDLAEECEHGIDHDAETPPSLPCEAGHIGPQGEAYLPTDEFFRRIFRGPVIPDRSPTCRQDPAPPVDGSAAVEMDPKRHPRHSPVKGAEPSMAQADGTVGGPACWLRPKCLMYKDF